VRNRSALAIAAFTRAATPIAIDAPGERLDGPSRPPPPVVRDPSSIYATDEDAVRELAVALYVIGEAAAAIALLEAQAGRGDDRALLQLAWLQTSDGLLEPARAAVAHYRRAHPDRETEVAELLARLR
jgi:hypothetical protein